MVVLSTYTDIWAVVMILDDGETAVHIQRAVNWDDAVQNAQRVWPEYWEKSLGFSCSRIQRKEIGMSSEEPPECPDHKEVQHRDMKPPWCNTCGWRRAVPGKPPMRLKIIKVVSDAPTIIKPF